MNNIFKSDTIFNTAVGKVEKEASMMKYLRLKSTEKLKKTPFNKAATLETAVKQGKSVVYPHLNVNIDLTITNPNRKQFLPTKLVFRENHPDFEKVVLEQQIKGVLRSATNPSIKTKNSINNKSVPINAT